MLIFSIAKGAALRILRIFFLGLANNLPRLSLMDYGRFLILRLEGFRINGLILTLGQLAVRPIGAARRIYMGKGSVLNFDILFDCPDTFIEIGEHVLIGPRVSFVTINHGLYFREGQGRGKL